MTEITKLLKDSKIQWAILKDVEAPKVDRREACKKIIEITNKIKELDPTFNVIDLSATQYAEFMPSDLKVQTNVNWLDSVNIMDCDQSVKMAHYTLDLLESLAIMRTKSRLPKESVETQKFGMIVSAYTDKYIALYTHFHKS